MRRGARRATGPAAAPAARPQRRPRDVGEAAQILLVAVERVARDEEADRLALALQLLLGAPRRDRRQRRRAAGIDAPVPRAKRPIWELERSCVRSPAQRSRSSSAPSRRGAVALERVEGPALDQALEHAPVHLLAPHAQAEVGEAGERAVLRAPRGSTRSPSSPRPSPRRGRSGSLPPRGGEVLAALVHVGRQDARCRASRHSAMFL